MHRLCRTNPQAVVAAPLPSSASRHSQPRSSLRNRSCCLARSTYAPSSMECTRARTHKTARSTGPSCITLANAPTSIRSASASLPHGALALRVRSLKVTQSGLPTYRNRGAAFVRASQPPRLVKADSPFGPRRSANTLYYLNVTQAGWYLSERPWLAILSPPTSNDDEQGAHLSVLTPAFELSRSQRLPFALTSEQRASVDWVTWEEADDPYEVLMDHLAGLRGNENESGTVWSVEVEENVRTFVRDGLAAAAQKRGKDGPQVGLAKLGVRELRMRKTAQEGAIQHCAAKVRLSWDPCFGSN